MSQHRKNKLKVIDYNPEWPNIFQELKDIFLENLKKSIVDVKHVGSTAVPGLCAKPNIDIDMVIKDYSDFSDIKRELSTLGYEYQGDFGIEGRESFKRKDRTVPWNGNRSEKYSHHLYVCPEDSRELERHLEFRDYLRENPDSKKRYGDLKRKLAREHKDDLMAYTEGKTKFIERVLEEII